MGADLTKYPFYKIKQAIGKKYQKISEDRLVEIPDFLGELLLYNETCVVTSNWTMLSGITINRALKVLLHSWKIRISVNFSFPTELVKDSKITLEANNERIQEFTNYLTERVNLLNGVEDVVKKWCSSPCLEMIVVWGLNMNVYDAEIIKMMMEVPLLRKEPYKNSKNKTNH